MKRLIAFATLLLASSAAHAGDSYSFEVGGRTIHIDAPSGCDTPSCVSISIPGIYESDQKRTKRARATPQADPQTKADPQPRVEPQAAPTAKTEPPPPQPSSGTSPAPATTATATNAPLAPAPASPRASEPTPSQAAPAPMAGPLVAAAPVSAPVQQQQVPAPAASRPEASPLGTWQTEEKEGLVRIEACGSNLCGYSVDAKTNQNGEKILINMRSVDDTKWTGRIHDPKSGSNYDSTIALKGPDSLRVQGCAFGGMFCGGQTWSRAN